MFTMEMREVASEVGAAEQSARWISPIPRKTLLICIFPSQDERGVNI